MGPNQSGSAGQNNHSLYNLLQEDHSTYWAQNGYAAQNNHNQFPYDPYQEPHFSQCYPHSMAYGNEGDYSYWGSYNFQPNQPVATSYTDYQNPAVQHSYNNNGCNMFYYEPGGFYSQPPQSKPKPIHTCDVCKKTFNYPYALQRHKKRKDHDNVKEHKCQLCKESFSTAENLKRHYNTIHKKLVGDDGQAATGLPSLRTVYAQKKNTRFSDLIMGLIELFECYYCHEVFQRYEDFRAHLSSAHKSLKKYVCPHKQCQKQNIKFDTLDALLEHAKNVHCNKRVAKKRSANKSLRCTICRAEFSRIDSLKRHQKVHEKKRLECPFRDFAKCKRTFYRIDDLKTHLEHHKDPKFKAAPFSCDSCIKVFSNAAQLEKHKKVHPSSKHSVICNLCQKGFKNAHGLRVHKCPAKERRKVRISAARKKSSARKRKHKEAVDYPHDSESDGEN